MRVNSISVGCLPPIENLEGRTFLSVAAPSLQMPMTPLARVVAPMVTYAPSNILGYVGKGTISDGSRPFASSGTYQFRPAATGNTYTIIGGPGIANSSGTYTYRRLAWNKAEIVLRDSQLGLVGTQTVTFSSATNARYQIVGNGGFQEGSIVFTPPPPKPSVAGVVFKDVNGNGGRDAGEKGISGWRVYVDTDNDGKYDSGEKSAISDATGAYKIANLTKGTFSVRQVPASGWRVARPKGWLLQGHVLEHGSSHREGLRGHSASGSQWHCIRRPERQRRR